MVGKKIEPRETGKQTKREKQIELQGRYFLP